MTGCVVIVDYDMGNLGSIANMIKKAGGESVATARGEAIEKAWKIILPGVGAFDNGMRRLRQLGLLDILKQKVLLEKTPLLGICLGMQLLSTDSEEGEEAGLGWVKARTVKFRFEQEVSANGSPLKIPHMGWNTVDVKKAGGLFRDMHPDPRFYFVHSYHLLCEHEDDVAAVTTYGYPFVSCIESENIWGAQFHPERSHKFGMKLLENFLTV